MSKQHSSLSGITGNGNVIPFIPARNAGHRIIALVVVLALASLAAAYGMRSDLAGSQSSMPIQATENPNASTESVYFPAQYVNQATEPTEHIQAF